MQKRLSLLVLLPTAVFADPIFPNSVVSNDIDFIQPSDPTVFQCAEFANRSRQEMPSTLRSGLFMDDVYVFDTQYSDGTSVPIWVDPQIGDRATAENYVTTVAQRVGQLPTLMRAPLGHIVINAGDAAATAEEDGGFFILYADNIDTRVSNHDLSETVFHEAAHVSLQNEWLATNDWQDAVKADAGFITDYAATRPAEDFAESALFAYTYLKNPDRLPADVLTAIEETIPNRVNVFDNIIVQWAPHTYSVGPAKSCR